MLTTIVYFSFNFSCNGSSSYYFVNLQRFYYEGGRFKLFLPFVKVVKENTKKTSSPITATRIDKNEPSSDDESMITRLSLKKVDSPAARSKPGHYIDLKIRLKIQISNSPKKSASLYPSTALKKVIKK